ncbi:MAG TPA: C25 family peptidase propeptide domain-containing protein, partial [candidate division Zixibacteria bacterium]
MLSLTGSVSGVNSISEYDDIQLLKSDQDGVIFKYLVPELNLNKIELGGQNFDLINIDRCALSNLPGKPQLPVRTVWIGIPLEGEVTVEILENAETERTGVNLAYAVKIEPGQENPVGYNLSPMKTKDTQNAFLPATIVSFDPPTFLRNQRVVELQISPVQYNPARRSIKQSSQITVKVSFSSRGEENIIKERDLFEKIYRNTLLNYEQSRGWRKVPEVMGRLQPSTEYPFGYSDNWFKLIIKENGLYKIDRTMLIQAGVPVSSLDPRTLRLFNGGGRTLSLDNSSPNLEMKELAIFVS